MTLKLHVVLKLILKNYLSTTITNVFEHNEARVINNRKTGL